MTKQQEYLVNQRPEIRECMLCSQPRVCYGFVCSDCIALNKFQKDRARLFKAETGDKP